jgi:hypothetical protein
MAYSGKFKPVNQLKYRGKVDQIQYRSSWELLVMRHLDKNPHVSWWSSEETVIPYFSEADQKKRRYFMDFTVCYNDGSTHLWEVKPFKQTQPPTQPLKMNIRTKARYMNEIYTFQTNLCKWKAANELCHRKGWVFKIVTEHTMKKFFGLK